MKYIIKQKAARNYQHEESNGRVLLSLVLLSNAVFWLSVVAIILAL